MNQIIKNLPNEEYHRGEAYKDYVSSSQLKHLISSPKVFRHMLDNPEGEKSDALRLGSLFHSAMELFQKHGTIDAFIDSVAVFEPPVNEKTGKPYGSATKSNMDAYAEFLQANDGKTICSADERGMVIRMADALTSPETFTGRQVRKLLKWAKEVETSYFHETEDGIKLKIRPDLLTNGKLVDWKTCSLTILDEDSITRQIANYGYHISLSMYQYVLHEITGKWYTPLLVFVQKCEPYDAVMVDIGDWCYYYNSEFDITGMGVGALEFKRLLDLLTKCKRENRWPGAEDAIPEENGNRIMKPAVPFWLAKKYEEI